MSRLRTLVRTATDGIVTVDTDSTIRYANPAVKRVLGYAPEDIEGDSLTVFMPERLRARHRAAFERYLETGERHLDWDAVRFPGRHADGHEVPLEVSFAEFEASGERLFTGIIRDITAREEHERNRREQTEQFQLLVQAVEEYAIFMLDPEGRVVTWNEGAERIKGYTEAEIRGEHVSTFYPADAVEAGRPERLLARAVDQGSVEDEGWRVRKDGTRFWANVTITAIYDDDGDLRGFTKVTRDMTDRKERERELQRYETIVETIDDIVYALDADGRFTFLNEASEAFYGVPRDEVLGQHASTVFAEETVAEMEALIAELVHDEERTSHTEELRVRTADGTEIWFEANMALLPAEGDFRGTAGVARDITERKRREDRLAGLNELTTAFLEADSRQQVADIVVDGAASLLNLPVALVALYSDSSGTLAPVAATSAAESTLDADELLTAGGTAWRAFAEGAARSLSDDGERRSSDGGPVGIWPLGRHGVFIASMDGKTGDVAGAFGATVAASMQTALDSAERRQLLEEREARLTDLTAQLEQLNRINDVIRQIDRTLVAASSRAAIEKTVCEELARFEPYRFVVVSAYDPLDEAVVAREWAGADQGYLDAVDLAAGPTGTAAETRDPQVVQELLSDPPLPPWREAAIARDFGSCLALPLVYRDSLYGVLTVFGARPGLFDEMEREILVELTDNIAHAINAVESKQALVSDRVVELEFTTSSEEVPFVALATESGMTFEFEDVVPQPDGRFRMFFTVRDADWETVRVFLRQTTAVEDCQLVADRDDDLLLSCLLTEESVIFHLIDHGVVPRELTATPGEGRLVVELSPETDIRAFVETLEARCPDVELTAKRERERSLRTRRGFRAAVEDSLTDRQLEVLQTAYTSGYFESPRMSTGEAVADSLGISQPTFSDHLRTAHRTLLALLFEEPPAT